MNAKSNMIINGCEIIYEIEKSEINTPQFEIDEKMTKELTEFVENAVITHEVTNKLETEPRSPEVILVLPPHLDKITRSSPFTESLKQNETRIVGLRFRIPPHDKYANVTVITSASIAENL